MIMLNRERVKEIAALAEKRLKEKHICRFKDMDEELLLISEQYPGLWLEHVYDSVLLAQMDEKYLFLAENAVKVFIKHQTDEGQLPFAVWDGNRIDSKQTQALYWQIQECVSFYTLCLEVYQMNRCLDFLKMIYASGEKWISWLKKYRMTTNRGLIEMFCGFDSGHDNSGRLEGFSCKGNYQKNKVIQNADVLPENDEVVPLLAVDMNCNFYGDLMALARMAKLLGEESRGLAWESEAKAIKENLFKYCWNESDAFFYDVDKNNRQRKYLSCTVFHLFLERVLARECDGDKIERIYREHIKNPKEFWTEYPFPSMAISDPSCEGHPDFNCWGYYTQGLTVLRSIRWLDAYGWSEELDYICESWLKTWTEHFNEFPLAQEIDPVSGKPTRSSLWYSSCMLFYIYSAKRLRIIE